MHWGIEWLNHHNRSFRCLSIFSYQWRRSCGGPGVLTPTLRQWGVQMCTDPHFFTAKLLYMACNPYSMVSVLPTVAEFCMHADFCTYIKHQCESYKDVWLHKLHQNFRQRMSGLCPDPLGSPREGRKLRKESGVDGWREYVASGLDPQDLWQIAATVIVQYIPCLSFSRSNLVKPKVHYASRSETCLRPASEQVSDRSRTC